MSEKKARTKTYKVSVSPKLRRWKLSPEDLTVIKLSLSTFSTKHKELEAVRKSLIKRMHSDFFMVLYATGTVKEAEVDVKSPEEANKAVNPAVGVKNLPFS
jgi:cell division septal protein FtsQ